MSITATCPVGASIPDVPVSNCAEGLGQLQKIILQRIFSATGTQNKFVKATHDPKLKASWSPLLTATDGTKVVTSPYVQTPKTTPGAARTFGGGNTTAGGIDLVIGRNPTTFTGVLIQSPQNTVKALKTYQGEEVGIYIVDENGDIALLADDPTNPTEYFPIPIYSLFVGDKNLGGLEAPDDNAISWSFKPNWSDNLVILTPTDFNALTDLVKPVIES